MNIELPAPFRLAKKAANKSKMRPQVGAVLTWGKSHIFGYNQDKTHPEYANPEKHVRTSLHAELDCLKEVVSKADAIYVYRELDGLPAMARPCNHCMTFIKEVGIQRIYYTIPHEPYWEMEEV